MKTLKFIATIFQKHPGLCLLNSLAAVLTSFLGAGFLFSIAPMVDIFLSKDQAVYGPLTLKAIAIFKFLGIPIEFPYFAALFCFLVIATIGAQILGVFLQLRTKYALTSELVIGTFRDCFNARWQFFSTTEQGKIYNTLNRELGIMGESLIALGGAFSASVQAIVLFGIPFVISWKVSLLCLVFGGLMAVVFLLLGRRSYFLAKMNTETANALSAIIYGNISVAKLVIGSGNAQRTIASLERAINTHLFWTIRQQVFTKSLEQYVRLTAVGTAILGLLSSRWFNVPVSEVMVILLALYQATGVLGMLVNYKNMITTMLPSVDQVESLRALACRLKHTEGGDTFTGFQKDIRLVDMSFAYPGREPVLSGVDLQIKKGQSVAFVGKSGSGKTTLVDILMGFYDLPEGQVLIDGIPLSRYNIDSYRQRIGYVPQESVLFNMSIRDNLLWSKSDASQQEIEEACRLAFADEFIAHLPEGYDTFVGDRGVRLSGGQVQRMALARAFLRKPEILFLDEATSSLDSASEAFIQKAISNVSRSTTIIMVAHRLATVKAADVIYVLDQGRIVESGSYDVLCSRSGFFSEMARVQGLGSLADKERP